MVMLGLDINLENTAWVPFHQGSEGQILQLSYKLVCMVRIQIVVDMDSIFQHQNRIAS